MVCGLASALVYFSENVKVREIMGLIDDSGKQSLGYNMILNQMRIIHTHQYFKIKRKEDYDEKNVEKNSHIKDCIFFVVLQVEDGSTSHSISICQIFIFDENTNFSLKLNKKKRGWCFSEPNRNQGL